jgi:hypothetical protein
MSTIVSNETNKTSIIIESCIKAYASNIPDYMQAMLSHFISTVNTTLNYITFGEKFNKERLIFYVVENEVRKLNIPPQFYLPFHSATVRILNKIAVESVEDNVVNETVPEKEVEKVETEIAVPVLEDRREISEEDVSYLKSLISNIHEEIKEEKIDDVHVFVETDIINFTEAADNVKEKTVTEKVGEDDIYNFSYEDLEKDGFIEPDLIDVKVYAGYKLIFFSTGEVTEDQVKDYLRLNFPLSEYRTSYKSNGTTFKVKIHHVGLLPKEELIFFIDGKLETRDTFRFFTTQEEDFIRKYLHDIYEGNERYHIGKRNTINDRISSFDISWFKVDSLFPSKEKLESIFVKSTSTNPTWKVKNVPKEKVLKMNREIHGYTFIEKKSETDSKDNTSIVIFKNFK